MRYYYKDENNNYYNLKEQRNDLISITEEEWNEHLNTIEANTPSQEELLALKQIVDQKKALKLQIKEAEEWFIWYDTQVMQYNRAIRLNVSTDIDIADLDEQAVTKAAQLKSYRQQYESLN